MQWGGRRASIALQVHNSYWTVAQLLVECCNISGFQVGRGLVVQPLACVFAFAIAIAFGIAIDMCCSGRQHTVHGYRIVRMKAITYTLALHFRYVPEKMCKASWVSCFC